jgi:type IV secretion system protein VirB9
MAADDGESFSRLSPCARAQDEGSNGLSAGWALRDESPAGEREPMKLRTCMMYALAVGLPLAFGTLGAPAMAQSPQKSSQQSSPQASPIPPLLEGEPGAPQPQASVTPKAGRGDPRIREILYDENQVVQLRGHLGFEIAVEFNPDERIENVSVGDSLSWQVTPNRKATMLFIKPMAKTTPTSMTVVTSQRIYTFMLVVSDSKSVNDASAMLRLRFTYPPPPKVEEDKPPAPQEPDVRPEALNFDYDFKGAKQLVPARVFDDGRATYFQFVENKDVPAVFVIGTDGKEETANTRVSGKYTVVDFTAKTFVLRYGKAKLEVKNRNWREPRPGPNGPAPNNSARQGGR